MSKTVKLSEARFAVLERGFLGPRPGSNAFPLLQIGQDDSRIDGEDLDAMFRAGYLTVAPAQQSSEVKGGDGGPYGEIPDIELMFAWSLTPAGRLALHPADSVQCTTGRGK